MVFFLQIPGCKTQCITDHTCNNVKSLYKLSGLPAGACYILCNGQLVQENTSLQQQHVYHVLPRVLGGKGGFGSMLRAIGAQIEKTTNREACRDLSGRRMRDVNNEKQLREWVAKAAEREQDRQQKKQERVQRRRAVPRHHFDDPDYVRQKTHVTEELEDALQQGLQNVVSGSRTTDPVASGSRKRSADSMNSSRIKKACEWLGIDPADLSDLSSDSDSDASHPTSSCTPQAGSCVTASSSIAVSTVPSAHASSDQTDETSAKGGTSVHAEASSVQAVQASTSSHAEVSSTQTVSSVTGETSSAHAEVSGVDRNSSSVSTNVLGKKELDCVESVQELTALGLDALKRALQTRGLKCGGTLEQRAERLFAVKGLEHQQIDPALFAKPAKGKKPKKLTV
ncbi:Replication stress response regulator SDE2 [Lamellibrachia satsuma]|nr:Replication stress response regulator SDE2 [Lamellibrachia satsuma]